MNIPNQQSNSPDVTLSDSSNLNTISTTSFVTSINDHSSILPRLLYNNRRKARIPTPNRPTIVSRSIDQTHNNDELPTHKTVASIEVNPSIFNNKPINYQEQNIINNNTDNQPETEKVDDEPYFDSFILEHFVPFSGQQGVIQWLDETENNFNKLKISRNLRFEAISLLVEGVAKRWYLKNRKEIQSFDDFYELLLLHFDKHISSSSQIKHHPIVIHHNTNQQTSVPQPSSTDIQGTSINIPNATVLTRQSPIFFSTVLTDIGATNDNGEIPANKSVQSTIHSSYSILDQTTNDLRKAIVADLIKNPKTFKGGRDDVDKWIEEIEHLLEVAHIPDTCRLDIISYSLRGDALQWYKNNKTLFTSWTTFICELKRAFKSSFHEELAFKKLEAYTQGENQSIRNFFNEVLKLCKEADSTMSESTKLKTLQNKAKPTIQFEVRKKKPTTTAEFLEYARDIEELFQLSNTTIDNTANHIPSTPEQRQESPLMAVPSSSTKYSSQSSPTRFTPGYSRNYNHYNTFASRYNPNTSRPSMPTSSFSHFRQPTQSQSRFVPQRFQSNKYNPTFNSINNNRTGNQRHQPNSSNIDRRNQSAANAIFSSDPTSNADPEPEILASIVCTYCNESGHEETTCPHF